MNGRWLSLLIMAGLFSGQGMADEPSCSPGPRPDGVDSSLPCIVLSPIADEDSVIFFERASDRLTKEARAILERQAETLRRHAAVTVRLVGYSDPFEAGASSAMEALAGRRAEAARAHLIENGIDGGRLVAIGRDYPLSLQRLDDEKLAATLRQVRTEWPRR